MAIPEDRTRIFTNLPFSRLNIVLDAIDKNQVEEVPNSAHTGGEGWTWEVVFENATYKVSEIYEVVLDVKLISSESRFVHTLINELEEELAVFVEKRNYDAAKEVNEQIESLKRLL